MRSSSQVLIYATVFVLATGTAMCLDLRFGMRPGSVVVITTLLSAVLMVLVPALYVLSQRSLSRLSDRLAVRNVSTLSSTTHEQAVGSDEVKEIAVQVLEEARERERGRAKIESFQWEQEVTAATEEGSVYRIRSLRDRANEWLGRQRRIRKLKERYYFLPESAEEQLRRPEAWGESGLLYEGSLQGERAIELVKARRESLSVFSRSVEVSDLPQQTKMLAQRVLQGLIRVYDTHLLQMHWQVHYGDIPRETLEYSRALYDVTMMVLDTLSDVSQSLQNSGIELFKGLEGHGLYFGFGIPPLKTRRD